MSTEPSSPASFRAGFAAIVGRPNAGKSTLLNAILGEKLVAVSAKPQTTRERVVGVKHLPGGQVAFVDTPGFHIGKKELNKFMQEQALKALEDVDVIILVVDSQVAFQGDDQRLLDAIVATTRPVLLVLNKIDKMRDKRHLLPLIDTWNKRATFAGIIPISAVRDDGTVRLLQELLQLLPEGAPLFPEDHITDRSLRYLAAEAIREQVFLQTNKEIPYSTAVTIDRFEDPREGLPEAPVPAPTPAADAEPPKYVKQPAVHISATVHVERDSQRAIVIGKGGQMLKAIGTAARQSIEALVGQKVFLELFVRVEPDWSQDPRAMKKLGYE